MIGVNRMTNLEWIFLITFIGALITLLSSVTFLALFVVYKKKYKHLASEKVKSKSKKRARRKELKQLAKVKKRSLIAFITFFILALGLGSASGYTSYYQAVNLSDKDSKSVVSAYYLLEDFDKELQKAEKAENKEKSVDNIRSLSGRMASYGVLKASHLNKEEGQIVLNRYYNVVKELGVNGSSQASEIVENKEMLETFRKDIKKAKTYQAEVFKFYKVDEKSLAKEV